MKATGGVPEKIDPPFDWGSPPRSVIAHEPPTISLPMRQRSLSRVLSPIPQKHSLPVGHLMTLLNGESNGERESPSIPSEKLERFNKECFHPNGQKKIPYADRKGLWCYREVVIDCEKILNKYRSITVKHPKVIEFIGEALQGCTKTLGSLEIRFGTAEHYFTREFPKFFRNPHLDSARNQQLDVILKDLEEERKNIRDALKQYDRILLTLMKVRKDREDPKSPWVVFPSLFESGAIFIEKPLQRDGVALEQFYFDYFEMLSMHEIYLHRFVQAIQQGICMKNFESF